MNSETTSTEGGRFDVEGDWIVRQMIEPAHLRLEPEEYVARHAYLWGCFSYHRYRFIDPELGAWVSREGELLSSEEEVEKCRQRFLSPGELAVVRRQAEEEW
jgi:hypothetical protein